MKRIIAQKNRIGLSNIYWLILEERIDVYLDCEMGTCK